MNESRNSKNLSDGKWEELIGIIQDQSIIKPLFSKIIHS